MDFNSFIFLAFLFVVVLIHYLLPQRYRASFLLLTSILFIGYFNIDSLTAVFCFSFFNFYIATKINKSRELYVVSILVNIFSILLFNYFNSSHTELGFYFSGLRFNIESVIIAIGMSYYSLQNIAYLTEIYFKRWIPESSFYKYVLYTTFFPKIVSGPIMLPNEFIPQITNNTVTQEKLISGFNRILLGLLKKVVIADRLAPSVNSIFDSNDPFQGLTTLTGVYIFTIQLYFDFSGYTDIALGSAKMLGYDLKENFNLPFRATSISEFWRRWHISLISWFSNYIYYPIVYRMRKHQKAATIIGISITFFISGIWHGIGFTFLIWASCHIIFLIVEFLTKQSRSAISEKYNSLFYKSIYVLLMFNAVSFSNIFFRSSSVEKAFQLIKNISYEFYPNNWLHDFILPLAQGGTQMDLFNLSISILIPIVFLLFEQKINKYAVNENLNVKYIFLCIMLIMLFGVFSNSARFIYMQF